MKEIKAFKGKNYFLSNFYPCFIDYEGRRYPSVECAYQAAKTLDLNLRYYFTIVGDSMEARRWGNWIDLRDDWDAVKYEIMYQLLKLKFQDPVLRDKLLATGDAYLEEGNLHGDRYWGTVKGEGQNNLGKILMKIRSELS